MAKGLCCAAQRAGDLGKPLIINVRHANGTTTQRCGTCEVAPSCRNPQKLVFAFRFLPAGVCNLPSSSKGCGPTAAGVAQYNAERTAAVGRGQTPIFETGNIFHVGTGVGTPYQLPPS